MKRGRGLCNKLPAINSIFENIKQKMLTFLRLIEKSRNKNENRKAKIRRY